MAEVVNSDKRIIGKTKTKVVNSDKGIIGKTGESRGFIQNGKK